MNKWLYSNEINCLASRMLAVTEQVHWLGVFARDEIPDLNRMKRPSGLIFNSDPKDKPGQHWLAIFLPKQGPAEFFDSFGYSPKFYSLESLDYTHQRCSYQSILSALCGHYCIMFIYFRSNGNSFRQIIELLDFQKSTGTDRFVNELVSRIYSRIRILYPCFPKGQCCSSNCVFC
jgi:hypothetical protein